MLRVSWPVKTTRQVQAAKESGMHEVGLIGMVAPGREALARVAWAK